MWLPKPNRKRSARRRGLPLAAEIVLIGVILAGAAAAAPPPGETRSTTPPGLHAGDNIPEFSAIDQNGRTQTLAALAGKNGLVLLFFRSADW